MAIEILNSPWPPLRPHFQRDSLYLVDLTIPLEQAAQAIADDDTELVQLWIQEGKLRRPSPAEDQHWAQETSLSFQFVIVQPYVLTQLISH